MAPEVGLEPPTTRLTAACSTIELLWNPKFVQVGFEFSNHTVHPDSRDFIIELRWSAKIFGDGVLYPSTTRLIPTRRDSTIELLWNSNERALYKPTSKASMFFPGNFTCLGNADRRKCCAQL